MIMACKRPFDQDNNDNDDKNRGLPGQEPKRKNLPKLWKNVFGGLSAEEFVASLEPVIRRVVREELSRTLSLYDGTSPRQEHPKARFYLRFANRLPSVIFTNSKIESEQKSPVRIELVDSSTNTVVTIGPLSSLKIEIVAVDGDFGSDEREDWTEEEFNAKVLKQREGKRPLVTGEVNLSLQAGVAYLGEIYFTDNSSWIRHRKFRLGARVVRQIANGVRAREGISEAFIVKDHRGEGYKKHHPPLPCDEVWRLEKISRDGTLHSRLQARGINTVEDFLKLYEINASLLRNILGSTTSNRTWDMIVQHAKECVINDGKFYAYYSDMHKVVLVFNSVYRVVATTFDGHSYVKLDALNHSQKNLVENLKRQAYKNLHQLSPLDPSNIDPSWNLTNLQTELSIGSTSSCLERIEYPVASQGQAAHSPGLNLSSPSTSYGNDAAINLQIEDTNTTLQDQQPIQLYNQMLPGNFVTGDFWSGCSSTGNIFSPPINSQGPFAQCDREIRDFQVQTPSMLPHSYAWTSDGFLPGSTSGVDSAQHPPFMGFHIHNPRISRPRVAWGKLRAVMKWATIWWKAAAKRKASLHYLDLCKNSYQD